MYVESTNLSLNNQEQNLVQPSTQDVVQHFLTQIGIISSEDLKKITVCLILLLESLSYNVLSRDKWLLSLYHMKDQAKLFGFSDDEIDILCDRILCIQKEISGRNPISGMF
jgi:hypothetical protein